jgi:hypothetical protein
MWEVTSSGDELTCDFDNEREAISISDGGLFRRPAEKWSHDIFRVLQHNRPIAAIADLPVAET